MIYFIYIYHIHLLNTQLTSSSWLEHRTSIARSRVQIPLKSWQSFSKKDNLGSCTQFLGRVDRLRKFIAFRVLDEFPIRLFSFHFGRIGRGQNSKTKRIHSFCRVCIPKNHSVVTSYDWLDLRCRNPPWGLFSDHYNDKYELGVILFLVRGSFLKGLLIKMFTATKTKNAYFGVSTCLLSLRSWTSHLRHK